MFQACNHGLIFLVINHLSEHIHNPVNSHFLRTKMFPLLGYSRELRSSAGRRFVIKSQQTYVSGVFSIRSINLILSRTVTVVLRLEHRA